MVTKATRFSASKELEIERCSHPLCARATEAVFQIVSFNSKPTTPPAQPNHTVASDPDINTVYASLSSSHFSDQVLSTASSVSLFSSPMGIKLAPVLNNYAAKVVAVVPDSPASAAGVSSGQILVGIGNKWLQVLAPYPSICSQTGPELQ